MWWRKKNGSACVEHTAANEQEQEHGGREGVEGRDETGRVLPVMITLAPVVTFG